MRFWFWFALKKMFHMKIVVDRPTLRSKCQRHKLDYSITPKPAVPGAYHIHRILKYRFINPCSVTGPSQYDPDRLKTALITFAFAFAFYTEVKADFVNLKKGGLAFPSFIQ